MIDVATRPGRRGRTGFTLIEVVLAMTALALVATICYGAFHLGIRAVEHGEVAVVAAQRLRVATDVLIRQLKSAAAYCARNEDDEIFPHFQGTATSLSFVTADKLEGGGGLARVIYRLEEDPPRLMLEETGFFSPDSLGRDPVDKPGDHAVAILEGFRTLKFEYLMNDGADTEWRPAWDGHAEEMMPSAVRVVVWGMPGIDTETWGQEIPIMVTSFGENQGECDEDELENTFTTEGADTEGESGDDEPEPPDDE